MDETVEELSDGLGKKMFLNSKHMNELSTLNVPTRVVALDHIGQIRQSLDDFDHCLAARLEDVEHYHKVISKARGKVASPDGKTGRVTQNLRFAWSIYSTVIESAVAEWEVLWKKIIHLSVHARLRQFKESGWQKPAKYFGGALAPKISDFKKAGKKFDEKFEEEVCRLLYSGAQHISTCSAEELYLLVVPEPSRERKLVPVQCWNVLTRATEVQNILQGDSPPPEFGEGVEGLEEVEGLLLAQREESKAAKVLRKLLNLRLSDVMPDEARRALEICVQMRHLRVHEHWTPDDGQHIHLARFVQETFHNVKELLVDVFCEKVSNAAD
ncbi:hypothetical protein AB1Y20_010598 [Prymnesium parvum]|uniref:Uncharacterized protein n=1 Tax=Prymnesium parvum TaxID=97485 RepID=A0AB34IRV4_PRYPA